MPNIIYLPPITALMHKRRLFVTALFFLLASIYSIITPIFEISDEVSHYPVIDYIADTGKLPVQNPARPNAWDWEAAQPPLYYALSAVLVAPFNRDDLGYYLRENPHAKVGIGLATDNHNFVLHDRQAEAFPWRGTPLHVHLLRFFSVLLGTGAVWFGFVVGRLVVPGRPAVALVGTLLTAFNPMFLAITGSVNNDNLVIFLAPLSLAIGLSIWRQGFSWARVWALALVVTLASAAKVSGAVLWLPAGLFIALTVWRDALPRRLVGQAAAVCLAVWLGLFGWWYVRNLHLYDDLLATNHMAQTVGLRAEPIGMVELLREEYFSFYAAFWGWFGAVNILAPMSLFYVAAVLQGLGMLGLLANLWVRWRQVSGAEGFWRRWWRVFVPMHAHSSLVPWSLLLLTLAAAAYSLLTWTLKTPASQGRLLFPFISIISMATALGLVRLFGGRGAAILSGVLLFFALYSVGVVIPRAFRPPAQVATLPADAQGVDVRYGAIELLGYRVDPAPIHPRERLDVTLYWRALRPSAAPLSFYVQVYAPIRESAGADLVQVGKLDSYPGRGLLQTDSWQTGVIYADRYFLEFENWQDTADFPFVPRLKVGWRDHATDEEIPATSAAGAPIDAVIVGGGRVLLPSVGTAENFGADFGGIIRLHDVFTRREGSTLYLNVVWEGLRQIDEDFTVFVHLIDPANPSAPLAFGDTPPRQGWWNTAQWVPQHRFYDRYAIPLPDDLPPGSYRVLIGFYRAADFTRLAVSVPPYADAVSVDVLLE